MMYTNAFNKRNNGGRINSCHVFIREFILNKFYEFYLFFKLLVVY